MSRSTLFFLFFFAVFLQSGTYGLTFLLPELFAEFGANEKDVGQTLLVTALTTLITVYYSGHLSDILGRLKTLGLSGFSIMAALLIYSIAEGIGLAIYTASCLVGFGWGVMYTLAPVVMSRLSDSENRVQMFSLYAVFMMAGFGLSPVYASWLQSWGFGIRDAFNVVAVFCAVSGSIFLLLPKAIKQHATTDTPDERSRLSLSAVSKILRSRAWVPVIMVFLGASVFAGVNNFQTVIAASEGLSYADYFLVYTITTVLCRIAFSRYKGGTKPYRIIGIMHTVMCASVLLFLFIDGSQVVYIACAILFAIGYGASYPVLVAMAANDADENLIPQTLQLFSLTYFVGIFGFPVIAGWLIVDFGISTLLTVVAIIAAIEASMGFGRHLANTRSRF